MPVGARELKPDLGAAVAVGQHHRRAAWPASVLIAPGHQGCHHWEQVNPFFGQPTFAPRPLTGVLVRDLAQDSLGYKPGQPVAQDLTGAPVRRCMSSNRRAPLNASRSTGNVHFSPTIDSAAAMLQFAVS